MGLTEVDILIEGGQVVSPFGTMRADIAVRDGKIAAVSQEPLALKATRTIDARGKHLLAGGIDPHVHMTSAGKTVAQSCQEETPSMALGGITCCFHFAQSYEDYGPIFERDIPEVNRWSFVDVGFHAILMVDRHLEELPRSFSEFGVRSFKMYMAAGGRELYPGTLSVDDGYLFRAFGSIAKLCSGALAMVHAENWEIAAVLAEELKAQGRTDPAAWSESRPAFCEEDCMHRAIFLAERQGCPLYIVHCSIGQTGRVIASARAEGVTVIAETCPHYLTVHKNHPRAMMAKYNPAIKEEIDVEGLWAGIRDGWVSTVGSDHIPVRLKDKDSTGKDIWSVRGGLPGSGTILPILLSEGVAKGRISIEKVAEVSSYNAARAFGVYPRKGLIAPGADADIVMVDLEKKVMATPRMLDLDIALFDGWEMQGWPVLTMVRGQVVAEGGEITAQPGAGRYVREV